MLPHTICFQLRDTCGKTLHNDFMYCHKLTLTCKDEVKSVVYDLTTCYGIYIIYYTLPSMVYSTFI